jgi:NADPH:quinone reductase
MGNYIVTTDEADRYFSELFQCIQSGLFKIRIEKIYPFTTEGVREAQKEISTPGNKIAGKILLNIADEEK